MSSIGKRRFEVEDLSLWNGLPEGLRRVKKEAKNYFFFKY